MSAKNLEPCVYLSIRPISKLPAINPITAPDPPPSISQPGTPRKCKPSITYHFDVFAFATTWRPWWRWSRESTNLRSIDRRKPFEVCDWSRIQWTLHRTDKSVPKEVSQSMPFPEITVVRRSNFFSRISWSLSEAITNQHAQTILHPLRPVWVSQHHWKFKWCPSIPTTDPSTGYRYQSPHFPSHNVSRLLTMNHSRAFCMTRPTSGSEQ